MFFKGILLPYLFCKNWCPIKIFCPYFFKTSSNSWGGALNPIHIGYILREVHEEMGRRKDGAVSPAIGTVLLVAMTVVFVALAAVVATGLAGGLFASKEVGLTLEPYGIASEERGVSITIHGGMDAGDLVALAASMNGPELVYWETEKPSVDNPVIGTTYRFMAEDRETISSARDNRKLSATLKTNYIRPMSQTNYFVTVTGKFSDGTEQVLLVQRVTLPAISEQGQIYEGNSVFEVFPYLLKSDSGGYPGHGFSISLLPGISKDTNWWRSVKFNIIDPKTNLPKTLSVGNGPVDVSECG